ncbi:MAG: hypothetical protein AAGA48_28780 [Myxococcota bacterium]
MSASIQQAIDELADFIEDSGGRFRAWYVGIAASPRRRLFDDHAVREDGDWAYIPLRSRSAAAGVERALLDLGCQGGPGGGTSRTRYAYVYRVTRYTRE